MPPPIDPTFYKFASPDALGGEFQATGDYSAAPVNFEMAPPSGAPNVRFHVARMIVLVSSHSPFEFENGILLQSVINSTVTTLTEIPIRVITDWSRYCYDVREDSVAGKSTLVVRWTFMNTAAPIALNGLDGDRMRLVLSDDLSGLSDHTFQFQGIIE